MSDTTYGTGHIKDGDRIMKPQTRKGLVAGAIVALVAAFIHSQEFNFDFFGWPGLIAWYLVSLLVGCGAGFIADLILKRIPAKVNTSFAYLGGALFGALGYYIQVWLFLLYVFSQVEWE